VGVPESVSVPLTDDEGVCCVRDVVGDIKSEDELLSAVDCGGGDGPENVGSGAGSDAVDCVPPTVWVLTTSVVSRTVVKDVLHTVVKTSVVTIVETVVGDASTDFVVVAVEASPVKIPPISEVNLENMDPTGTENGPICARR
jgi:hypothetical protein